MDGGHLYDAMKKGDDLAVKKAAGVTQDILRGLSHMHRRGFFHRDIKPENILVDARGVQDRDLGCSPASSVSAATGDYVSTALVPRPSTHALRSRACSSSPCLAFAIRVS